MLGARAGHRTSWSIEKVSPPVRNPAPAATASFLVHLVLSWHVKCQVLEQLLACDIRIEAIKGNNNAEYKLLMLPDC